MGGGSTNAPPPSKTDKECDRTALSGMWKLVQAPVLAVGWQLVGGALARRTQRPMARNLTLVWPFPVKSRWRRPAGS